MSFKIYTKIGDRGYTYLGNGKKTKKNTLRIAAYGSIDELNSSIGVLQSSLNSVGLDQGITAALKRVQEELFCLGSELANPDVSSETSATWTLLNQSHIMTLENEIDFFTEHLSPLRNFILPGGSLPASHTHIARCICRRAELSMLALDEQEPIRDAPRIYINRLSDWLFTMARFINHKLNVEDAMWNSLRA